MGEAVCGGRTAALKPLPYNTCRMGAGEAAPGLLRRWNCGLAGATAGGRPGVDADRSRDGACRAHGVLCCGLCSREGHGHVFCWLIHSFVRVEHLRAPGSVMGGRGGGRGGVYHRELYTQELWPCLSWTLSHRAMGSGVVEVLRGAFRSW